MRRSMPRLTKPRLVPQVRLTRTADSAVPWSWGLSMGDLSAEPSMEDILSSIKRIIAEEGETATMSRARRAVRPATPRSEPGAFGHDEILELSEPVEPADDEAPRAHAPVEPQ